MLFLRVKRYPEVKDCGIKMNLIYDLNAHSSSVLVLHLHFVIPHGINDIKLIS